MTTHYECKLEEAMKRFTPEVIVDFEIETDRYDVYSYSSDQMNVDYPVRFPTVTVEIKSQTPLSEIADEVMHREGYGGMWDAGCDNLWYEFHATFYQLKKDGEIKCENRIVFEPVNHPEFDDGRTFTFDLNEENQIALVKWFEVVATVTPSAKEVFNEARNEMLEEYYETKDLI